MIKSFTKDDIVIGDFGYTVSFDLVLTDASFEHAFGIKRDFDAEIQNILVSEKCDEYGDLLEISEVDKASVESLLKSQIDEYVTEVFNELH